MPDQEKVYKKKGCILSRILLNLEAILDIFRSRSDIYLDWVLMVTLNVLSKIDMNSIIMKEVAAPLSLLLSRCSMNLRSFRVQDILI